MIKVHDRLRKEKLGGRMILQVHDELLLEVPDNEIDRTTAVGLDAPIMTAVYRILYEGLSPHDAVQDILSRPQKGESTFLD